MHHRRKIRRSMASRAHVIQRRKVGDLLQVRDAAAMHHRHANVIDPLVANQIMRIPDRIEDLAHRNRRRGVLADHAESLPATPPASGLPSRRDETAPAPCPVALPQSASAGDGSRAAGAVPRQMSSRTRANSFGTWRRYRLRRPLVLWRQARAPPARSVPAPLATPYVLGVPRMPLCTRIAL